MLGFIQIEFMLRRIMLPLSTAIKPPLDKALHISLNYFFEYECLEEAVMWLGATFRPNLAAN